MNYAKELLRHLRQLGMEYHKVKVTNDADGNPVLYEFFDENGNKLEDEDITVTWTSSAITEIRKTKA